MDRTSAAILATVIIALIVATRTEIGRKIILMLLWN